MVDLMQMQGQGDRIAELLRQAAQPSATVPMDYMNAAAATQSATMGNVAGAPYKDPYETYQAAIKGTQTENQATAAKQAGAEVDIYNTMKNLKDQGDQEAKDIWDKAESIVGKDPAKIATLFDEIHKDQEEITPQNFLSKALPIAQKLGITDEMPSLELQAKKADIARDQAYADYYAKGGGSAGKEPGGVTGYLVQKYMEDNPGTTFSQALYTVQTGMRQGTTITNGSVAPLPGITETKKNIKGAEAEGTATGKAQGEEGALLADMEANMPQLEAAVVQLKDLGHKATYTAAGQKYDEIRRQTGQEPREASIAREAYIAHVKNNILPILRQTFGAQFTQIEGEKLLATLGDPNLSPPEKEAVLNAFIQDKRATIESQRRRVGAPTTSPSAALPGPQSIDDQLKAIDDELNGL